VAMDIIQWVTEGRVTRGPGSIRTARAFFS
jgi:hypothetical protein